MQMLVTCTEQEPMVTIDSNNKEGDKNKESQKSVNGGQNREPLKKKGFFFKNEQNEFYAEALGAFAERLEKNPIQTNTLYQVDVTISIARWESDRTHEKVFKNQIRLNKISKVNFEGV